ncbi:FHA domain-containing protein [Fibrella forsythiae]|uniref:FHA domain-containing protein n=1 Tax=Fibrella forsythiae TaxID=2817061 RepID=A0ABS3JCK8_9BACT|nr:FHA domain-containing protein [Fibrella forsythiae]MBO0947722.1 FHA domain-containing protein [Fibrella forsythiae]
MEKTPSTIWDQLGNLLVPKRQVTTPRTVSNEQILHELIRCFETSLNRESIGTSLLFDASYVVILHPASYAERLAALPVIVNEAVNAFSEELKKRNQPPNRIVTVASHWHFKFGPGTEFDNRPITPADVEVIGSLTGASLENDSVLSPKAGSINLKATRKVKNTNVYDKLDLNLPAFSHIDFREPGAFAVRIDPALLHPVVEQIDAVVQPAPQPAPAAPAPGPVRPDALARIDCYMADQNTEETYWMKDREIVVARREPDNELFTNYIRLASPYVSNPHARIRYNEAADAFQLASFSRHETRLNEVVVSKSEPGNPDWVDLPSASQILLNGVVTLTFQRIA